MAVTAARLGATLPAALASEETSAVPSAPAESEEGTEARKEAV